MVLIGRALEKSRALNFFAKITRPYGAWIDRNWNRLQNLCVDEAIDAGIEKPWVKATLMTVGSDEVKFQIKSNSQYVFQYMLTESIKKDIKKR